MGAGALETDVCAVILQCVDENPVWTYMAITTSGELSAQRMILVEGRQWIAFNQQVEDRFKLGQVLSSFSGALHVLLELSGPTERPHRPKSRYRSSFLVNRLRP